MESIIRKTGIYGLIFGLAIAILFVDYKVVTPLSDGGYMTAFKPITEYIITILRFGIIGMFVGIYIGWKNYHRKDKTEQRKSYYIEFFIAVFLIALMIMLGLNW